MTLKHLSNTVLSVVIGAGCLFGSGYAVAASDQASIAEGKKIAFDRKKGNCLACHMIADGSLPGDIGPPLVAMKARFPNKAALRAQIWNASAKNPNTIMPPFGRHQILSDSEIDKITDFIHSL